MQHLLITAADRDNSFTDCCYQQLWHRI